MKGQSLFQSARIYYAIYDNVDGLSVSRPVTINGFKVGLVEDIYFHPDASGKLVVKMNITSDFIIPKTSVARIHSEDILGGKSISLKWKGIGETALSGDTLLSEIQLTIGEEVNRQVAPLKDKAEKMISSIDTVLTLMSGFLDSKTRNNFTEAFTSIKHSFEMLEKTVVIVSETVTKTQGDFEAIVSNVADITDNLKNNGEELDAIFNNVEAISDSLSKIKFTETFASLENTIKTTEEIINKVNAGEGSLGLLINDPALYNDLENASEQLNKLIMDIRYNPNRYLHFSVFGSSKSYSEEEIKQLEEAADQ